MASAPADVSGDMSADRYSELSAIIGFLGHVWTLRILRVPQTHHLNLTLQIPPLQKTHTHNNLAQVLRLALHFWLSCQFICH